MPDQVVPITQLDGSGVILDNPPVSLPPNAFTNARNVRFKDGAVRKMEGEVDIFEGVSEFFDRPEVGQVQYVAWWPSPNQTTRDRGYYIFVVEVFTAAGTIEHHVYAMLPGANSNNSATFRNITPFTELTIFGNRGISAGTPSFLFTTGVVGQETAVEVIRRGLTDGTLRGRIGGAIYPASRFRLAELDSQLLFLDEDGNPTDYPGTFADIFIAQTAGYSNQGRWQHTLFNGGFTFIINNGVERPQYITDPEGNVDIGRLGLSDLPGWDSYQVDELILRDTFDSETDTRVFDTGQTVVTDVTRYVVQVRRTGITDPITIVQGTGYTLDTSGELDVITFADDTGSDPARPFLLSGDELTVNFQSINPVETRAAIVRSFGDFLVAGNLVERDTMTTGNPIIRRLTGIVRSSDVAQPGSIPNNWNPFAAGVSTADEFVIADTGTVQDMIPLQGNLYLYTNSSISVMRLTGNAQVPLTVQPVTDQYGTLTTDAVLEYDGKHFVIGSDDIYLFGGHPGSIQSISDQKVRRAFFDRVNPINNNTRNLFTLRYAARDEIWVCFPTVNSVRGECNEAFIWNYRAGSWTIRTLNSVIRGDVGPLPGGGIPSAVIEIEGESGTNDLVQIGGREVQTISVDAQATIGHATSSRPELYSFTSLAASPAPASVPRPALTLNAPELVEVAIGDDFYSGPNPAMQEYNIVNIPSVQVGSFTSGGVRFRIEYTLASSNTGNNNTQITVHANELTLPGTGNRTITGAQYAAVLAPHLDGLTEFRNWTITANGNSINLLSDFAGVRELRALDITTFSAMVEEVTDTGPFTTASRVFTDTFGDELFTVTRSGSSAPFTYSVTTARNTGFSDSDSITQLAFVSGGQTFVAPDPFSRTTPYTFQSTSNSYAVRSQPPANFVNLIRETDRLPDNGEGTFATATTEDGVTIERTTIVGTFRRSSSGSDTHEGVIVTVRDTSSGGVARRSFQVNNTNQYPIDFRSNSGVEFLNLRGNSATVNGPVGSDEDEWSWVSDPISGSGTAIAGSGTQDLRGAAGLRTTNVNGVTVTTQNTSTPQSTTTATERDQAVLLPSTNGNSVSNPLTATWNPSSDFIEVNWRGFNNASLLSAYRLSDGTRVTGGRNFGRGSSNNPPPGWDNGFESGSFPQTPLFSAANIPNPINLGAVNHRVMVGVQSSNSQGTTCQNFQTVTASSNFGANGIRQSGTGTFDGPSVGIQARRGRSGYGWTRGSTGRSNECGGNLNGGFSFAGDFRVYTPGTGTRATGVRLILFGPEVSTTINVPRVSSETFTVNNPHPFPVTFSAGGQTISVPADSARTLNFNSEGNSWSLSTTTTTEYQFTVTNNNIRPLVSGTITHGSGNVDLAGLEPGQTRATGVSTDTNASVTFVRELAQTGAMVVTTAANLQLVRSGVIATVTDPADLEPVTYRFMVPFTDTTPDIDVTYRTPENRNPTAANNLNNIGAVAGYVAALNADTEFTTYFRTITNAEDSEIPTDRFRIEALAYPGDTIPGTSTVMPPHDALLFSTPINTQHGGNADITVMSIQRAVGNTNEPVALTLDTGPRVFSPDGTLMDINADDVTIVLNGAYPAGATGTGMINEVVRDTLRLDPMFNQLWDIQTNTQNPSMINLESDNNGPHHLTVRSVTPASSGLLPTHFNSFSTQPGLVEPDNPTYPTITIDGPVDSGFPQIELELAAPATPTDRLTNADIANLIRARIDMFDGWTVVSGNDDVIGPAVAANQIRIVRDDEGIITGTAATTGWRIGVLNYGNTGNTLPGEPATTDGTVVGRLNTSDFTRASAQTGNALSTTAGIGDQLDFRGSVSERTQPTRIMISISSPDFTSLDPVVGPDGNFIRNEDGTISLTMGNTQYIPLVFGGDSGYNPVDQTGNQPIRRDADFITNAMESAIIANNRRVQVTRTGNQLSVIPSQFSGLANFVVDIFINDSVANVERWNTIVEANGPVNAQVAEDGTITADSGQIPLFNRAIDTSLDNGVQTTVPQRIVTTSNFQYNTGNRVPNYSDRNIITTGLVTNTSSINTLFDPLRPWPTTQVNLNQEYPIFATALLNSETGALSQNFRGADLGFLFLGEQYESFVERIELALTPEFDTEQLQSLAIWGDGGSLATFGDNIDQAVLTVKMYGTNAPGQTLGEFNNNGQNTASNEFIVGEDYKIDMRVHGRFLNYLITDYMVTDNTRVPNEANLVLDRNLNIPRGISWNLSGMQADIFKGGRR